MSNPYTTLNVPTTADAETIRRAHRKAAKKAHSDHGGSDEAMREVNNAWMVLRDPSRRQRYDRTGETEVKDTAVQDLLSLFIRACELASDDISPVELATRKINSMMTAVEVEQRKLYKAATRHRRTARRIKSTGENLLQMALENHADGMDKKAASATIELERLGRMAGILRNYRYEMEPKPDRGFTLAVDPEMEKLFGSFGK